MFARIAGLILVLVGGFLFAQPVTEEDPVEATVEDGWLGMNIWDYPLPRGDAYRTTVWVWAVDGLGPAYKSGIRVGDAILRVNGVTLANAESFPPLIPNEPMTLELRSRSSSRTKFITVTPAARSTASMRQPILQLNTGLGRESIFTMDANEKAGVFVTGAFGGQVTIRRLSDGSLVKNLRGQTSVFGRNELFGVALSPDGSTIATLISTQNTEKLVQPPWGQIRLFDSRSGQLKGWTFLDGSSAGPEIVFFPDGDHMAVAREGYFDFAEGADETEQDRFSNGVSIIRVSDASEVKRISQKEAITALDIANDGRIATVTETGKIHLYDEGLQESIVGQVPLPGTPQRIEFSPDGMKLAIAYLDQHAVSVLSSDDLSLLFQPLGREGDRDDDNFSVVEWSADGEYLYAGGVHTVVESDEFSIRRWGEEGRGNPIDIDVGVVASALRPWGKSGILAANFSGDVIAFDEDGKVVFDLESGALQYFESEERYNRISLDGMRLQIGKPKVEANPNILDFDIRKRIITNTIVNEGEDFPYDEDLFAPEFSGPGIQIEWSDDGRTLLLNGKQISRENAENISIAVVPNGSGIIASRPTDLSSGFVTFLNRDGTVRWSKFVRAFPQRINASGDGRLAIVSFADGTVRWYRAADGEELLSLYIHAQFTVDENGERVWDYSRWVIWTPEGYYDASAGGEDFIGWQINQGADKEALFYGASRFRDLYYRPDIIRKTLETLTVTQAPPSEQVLALLPPVVRILDVDESVEGRASVRYEINSPSGKPVTEFRALVDGRVYDLSDSRAETTTGIRELEVILQPGDQQITLVAATEDGFGEEETRGLARIFDPDKPVERNLYALVIGISDYQDDDLRDLSFADDDAKDVTAALTAQSNSFYRNVETKTLMDGEATRDAILGALDWLRTAPGDQDVSLLFLAGHGINQLQTGQLTGDVPTGTYYFLPNDVDLNSLSSTGVSYDDLLEYIHHARGYKILALDTCHSGQVDSNGLVNRFASDENGVIVFASSTASQTSTEKADWENGAFTEALLEGLEGQADDPRLPDQLIDHLELGGWLNLRVKNLTNGNQTPIVGTSRAIPATTIAAVVGQ